MYDHELDQLSKRERVAVAAVCVEHVIDFYRLGNFSLQVKHAPRDLGAPASKDLIEHALEVAWSFVATGQADAGIIDAILEGMRQPPTGADPEDMCTAGDTVITGVAGLLETIDDPTPAQAVDTLLSGASAVWDGVLTATRNDSVGRAGKDEERAWQKDVIDRALQRKGTSLSRSDFADLLAAALSWKQHLPAYRAQVN